MKHRAVDFLDTIESLKADNQVLVKELYRLRAIIDDLLKDISILKSEASDKIAT